MNTLQNTLVEQYVPLAKKLAYQRKKALPKFIEVDDLISAAYMGLVEAASRFDEGRNVCFSTYAYPRINGAIYDWLREQGWGKYVQMVSLDSSDEDGVSIEVAAKEEPHHEEVLDVVSQGLGDQAKNVLRYYFIEQRSMKEVGEKIGVTEGRISQIVKACTSSIRQRYEKEELRELLAA